ncbi:MAG: imidazole glycerol phosphate synthase subunit HisH [Acidobacteria bacterium]|nr:imidazole glycerol phosphate synthase subunit HisH [Acidobacteriota bacterium]
MRVALVDYGAGNLTSVRKALRACGADVFTPDRPEGLTAADAVVIPGVGHFAATAVLDAAWRAAVCAAVASGRALLGICLGQQWLFEGSSEAPDVPGLGLLHGRCAHLREMAEEAGAGPAGAPGPSSDGLKVPHVGWNDLAATRPSDLLLGLAPGSQAYFTHAYAAPMTSATVATTTHGARFASAVQQGRICGVQFHPEKSGDVGLRVLANFLRQAGER